MKALFSVAGKTIIVTGGSRGIGEMIAEGFLANGAARVFISARRQAEVEATAERLSSAYDGECIAVVCDLATTEGREIVARALGDAPLHGLVNNAGAAWGAPLDEFPEHGWDKVMDINVKAMFFLTQRLLPNLRAAATQEDPARIINIGSVDGLRIPRTSNFSYSASKAAVHHMTRVLAAELAAEEVNVNAIAPGPFPSKMMAATLAANLEQIANSVPKGRIGEPEDIAGVAVFLASRAGAYVTGATIPCDGGISTATRFSEVPGT